MVLGAEAPCSGPRPSTAISDIAFAASLRRRSACRWRPVAGTGAAALRARLLAALALLLPLGASGAYFYVEEGKERCFQQDLREHEVLRLSYTMHEKELLGASKEKKSECKIEVKAPTGKVVKDHALQEDSHEGALAFAARLDGEHQVCLQCVPQQWFGHRKMRWSIVFDTLGAVRGLMPSPNIQGMASLSQLNGPKEGIEQLLERVAAINTENEYERKFEQTFSRTSEAVNRDVTAFKLGQVLLIAAVTGFQLMHMGTYLKSHAVNCVLGCLPMSHKPGRPVL
eukprot:TRINITY_DN14882_c0_g1_i1.p1 TRINITY_DN14882_c0_g1~~TRINITY_DN14882_c0_g1_i1.p1  ORF type:complete len:284 (-),score=65.20 TRINITY_DN14882_c0_g1_i1:49-900(-)